MPHTLQDNLRIFSALLSRDMRYLKSSLPSKMIDSIVLLSLQVFQFGYMFPLFGMPENIIAPLYLGMSFVLNMFFSGFSFSTVIVHMIPNHGPSQLEYHLTLPLPKRWLFGQYIASYIIETLIITIPIVTVGFWLLWPSFSEISGSWVAFGVMYLTSLLFNGVFFMMIAFYYEQGWFWNNIWPRRLSWLLNFSAALFTWRGAYALSPVIGTLILASPFTYIAEGLRASLLGGDTYLPFFVCFIAVIGSTIICVNILAKSIKKRLDPV